jgi:Ala-tRNA(Pro) deacylase
MEMNENAFERICSVLAANDADYQLLRHPPCRTSQESAQARARAGFPLAIGAKALVVKMTHEGRTEYDVLVLPGICRINSQMLKTSLPGLKKFRFASSDELLDLCGLVPGAMPPFGSNVFPRISQLFVDKGLLKFPIVGFNAADLEKSIVVDTATYLHAARPDQLLCFAE